MAGTEDHTLFWENDDQALSEICSVASPRGPRRGQAAEAKGPGDGFFTR